MLKATYDIKVNADPPELDPTSQDPTSTVKITVSVGGLPARGEPVEVEVCTDTGGANTDGHIHDNGRDPCDQKRFVGSLTYLDPNDLLLNLPQHDYPIEKQTDKKGEISFTYNAPSEYYLTGGKCIS